MSNQYPIIAIGAGHGGPDPGAIGPNGEHEEDFTLDIAKRTAKDIENDYLAEALLIRSADINVPLHTRDDIAEKAGAIYYLSIHLNSSKDPTANGYESFRHPNASKKSTEIQKIIHADIAAYMALFGIRDRGMKTENFAILRETSMPATLIETFFISNPKEVQLFHNEHFKPGLSKVIAGAIAKALKLKKKAGSDVYIREYHPSKFNFKVDLGTPGKLEPVSQIVKMRKAKAGINLGQFPMNGSAEHYGLFMIDGKILNPPSQVMECYLKDGKFVVTDFTHNSQVPLDADFAAGLQFSLVINGKKDIRKKELFPHADQKEPRTAIGQRADGTMLWVTVDAPGMTADELADLMLSLGCVMAICADGGGSTTMAEADEDGNVKVVNKPEYGEERAVGSVLLACPKVAKEKYSDISGHWARELILAADKDGLIAGYPDGTFRPDSPATRAQMVAHGEKLREQILADIIDVLKQQKGAV